MNSFIKVAATKASFSCRKLIYNIGINDADYMVRSYVNGKRVICASYVAWHGMIRRCYDKKFQELYPTYKGYSVCREWLKFSNFDKWHDENYKDGFVLSVGIKDKKSTIHSKESCLYVPQNINKLLNTNNAKRGALPIGVKAVADSSGFSAIISINGEKKHIGTFCDASSAAAAYKRAKNKQILKAANENPTLSKYLKQHLIKI